MYETMIKNLFGVYLVVSVINGFNLSPKPNMVLREPQLKTFQRKERSSYFGFSLNLRTNSIIIGSPRAQSTLQSQSTINEPGSIYKCSLTDQICEPYVFDALGNISENGDEDEFTINSAKKDYQWLGMSMDGSGSEQDRFVVCSPRTLSDSEIDQSIHGICYWTTNTSDTKPFVRKITPLRLKSKQRKTHNNITYFYYIYGEQGISAHITDNQEEILIGAPGIMAWKGSVIRYRAQSEHDLGGLSRRDQHAQRIQRNMNRDVIRYTSDVPNPLLRKQSVNSYFGYAVSSGVFGGPGSTKTLYLASAPQANLQQGEVYIFDIVDHYTTDKTILIHHLFSSEQIGSYYGYALITDDFNGDGFTDVVIAAPLYSNGLTHDNGAVYIYENQGIISNEEWTANFVLHSTLMSDYLGNGRFGTTVSRIGDINQDGFMDLAVGAPYEENGVVYIFLGGRSGIVQKPSQRLVAPHNSLVEPFTQHMYGHGLSKGVDIDGNNFLDLAVGAPNAETVYVYRAYPVVKIKTQVITPSKELLPTDSSFMVKTCWSLESKFDIPEEKNLNILLKIDLEFGRATLENQNNQIEFNVTAGNTEQCFDKKVFVKFFAASVYKPIDIEMHHKMLDIVPDSEGFCTKCVAVNPRDSKVTKNEIVFNTGCKKNKCIADLKLKAYESSLPYIIGSSKTLPIEYEVQNFGETAYLTQINISIPEMVSFAKIPSSCILNAYHLLCDFNSGSPLYQGNLAIMTILLDTTKVEGSSIVIRAHVFSTGDELNDADNLIETIIPLAEFSDLEISGKSSQEVLSLENGLREENITHIFEIRNNGPSNIKSMDVTVSIPLSYLDPWTFSRISLIDFENIVIKVQYNDQDLDVEWRQNNTILIQNPIESSFPPHMTGSTNDLANTIDESGRRRWRRSSELARSKSSRSFRYNRYTRAIVEEHLNSGRSVTMNRTLVFDCYDAQVGLCVQAKFSIYNFKVDNDPIDVAINFTIDLKKIDKIVNEKRDIFVMKSSVELIKIDDEDGHTINVIQTHPYTIIRKYLPRNPPIFVYNGSALVGILILAFLTYRLYRANFFKRPIKEEHEKLIRESLKLEKQETNDKFKTNIKKHKNYENLIETEVM